MLIARRLSLDVGPLTPFDEDEEDDIKKPQHTRSYSIPTETLYKISENTYGGNSDQYKVNVLHTASCYCL